MALRNPGIYVCLLVVGLLDLHLIETKWCDLNAAMAGFAAFSLGWIVWETRGKLRMVDGGFETRHAQSERHVYPSIDA
jgi:hypothetical protein